MPPLRGWTLIFGSALPEPGEDVDKLFRFLMSLSRRLGQVQYFYADKFRGHHAWVCLNAGRTRRAYAWAGVTLWNEGALTQDERVLFMQCYDYGVTGEGQGIETLGAAWSNIEKLPLLASRWSIDPVAISGPALDELCGVAGEAPAWK
jgi:hypothetical protein